MEPQLTVDQILRALAALEAAWMDDDDALAALTQSAPGEKPLAALVAEYAGSRMEQLMVSVTINPDLHGADLQQAVAQYQDSPIAHLTHQIAAMLTDWATSARDDAKPTGDLTRCAVRTLLSFIEEAEDERAVKGLFAHLRADALAHA